jgi:hypothetical protein
MDESNIEKRTRMGRLMSPPPFPKKTRENASSLCLSGIRFRKLWLVKEELL